MATKQLMMPRGRAACRRVISDVASVLLGGGDRHQNDDVPQDLRLREAAALDVQRAMNEQRV